MLQKLIDHAVDDIFAEYDDCKSIQTRAVALMDGGERRTIKLNFGGGLTALATIFTEADSAIEATGATSGISIIYVFDQSKEMAFISAGNEGHKAMCALVLERKTGVSTKDLVLVSGFKKNDDSEIRFYAPTEWMGRVCEVGMMITSTPFFKPLM
jgi:hypothetical protein